MPKNNVPKFRNFGLILYPDNRDDMDLLRYLNNFVNLYHAVYILHDKDRFSPEDIEKEIKQFGSANHEVGEIKTPHYHVLFCYPSAVTASSMCKHLCVNFVEPISSALAQYEYILHVDRSSLSNEYKHTYSPEELQGYTEKIMRYFKQNSNFVELRGLAEMVEADMSLIDIVKTLSDSGADFDDFSRYQYMLVAMANQRDRYQYKYSKENK